MAASSSATFFGLKEEELRNHLNLQHSSGGANSGVASSAAAAAPQRKKRNQPGTPSPDAEVIALSPDTLMATNRFVCEVCNKGFQREQNLQLHRRGHNLPWKLKQKTNRDARKKVYLCPEPGCVHHDPSRALGDLTGIKKHFSRKHGEKKFRCEKCNKKYAVHSDWKAHSKTCGTKEYRCECGTTFSRRDSFVTHRAFCDALAQETARHTLLPASLSSMAATIYAHASGVMSSLGSSGPLVSADHQEPSAPVFGLGAPAAGSRSSFTGLLSGQSGGSAFRPIQSLTMPIQPPEPKHNFSRFSDFSGLQGLTNNTTSAGPMFNLGFNGSADVDSPHSEADLNMNGPGLLTGLMMNADPLPGYSNISTIQSPQLSATALLQKAALMGSSSNSAALLKGLGSSSSSGVKFSSYGGVLGAGVLSGGGGASTSIFQDMYSTMNAGGGGYGNGGFGGGMGLSENNPYGGVMYNVKNDDEAMELDEKAENSKVMEPQSVQSGNCDKLTRDFLGMGKRMTSFSDGMEDDHKGNGMKSNSPDSEATTSAEPNPFALSRGGF